MSKGLNFINRIILTNCTTSFKAIFRLIFILNIKLIFRVRGTKIILRRGSIFSSISIIVSACFITYGILDSFLLRYLERTLNRTIIINRTLIEFLLSNSKVNIRTDAIVIFQKLKPRQDIVLVYFEVPITIDRGLVIFSNEKAWNIVRHRRKLFRNWWNIFFNVQYLNIVYNASSASIKS